MFQVNNKKCKITKRTRAILGLMCIYTTLSSIHHLTMKYWLCTSTLLRNNPRLTINSLFITRELCDIIYYNATVLLKKMKTRWDFKCSLCWISKCSNCFPLSPMYWSILFWQRIHHRLLLLRISYLIETLVEWYTPINILPK